MNQESASLVGPIILMELHTLPGVLSFVVTCIVNDKRRGVVSLVNAVDDTDTGFTVVVMDE